MSDFESTFFQALADLTRRRILMLLAAGGELCVCELVDALELAQPRVSSHLAALRKAGIVNGRKQGLWVHYALSGDLPGWARRILQAAHDGLARAEPYRSDAARLSARPDAGGRASLSASGHD